MANLQDLEVKKVLEKAKSLNVFLKITEDGFLIVIEENLEEKKDKKLMYLKLSQQKGETRLTIYKKSQYGSRRKKIITIPHRNNKAIELYILEEALKKTFKMEFERKILLHDDLFYDQQYSQFIFADKVIGKDYILIRGNVEGRILIDLAMIKNGFEIDQIIENMEIAHSNYEGKHQMYLYNREKGILSKIDGPKMSFLSFYYNGNSGEWKNEIDITIKPLNAAASLNIDARAYDLTGNLQEFKFDSFEVVSQKMYFIGMGTYLQKQMKQIKIEVCDQTPTLLNLCILSGINLLELDELNTGVDIWRGYASQEMKFDNPHYKYNLHVLYLKDSKSCEILQKVPFNQFKNAEIKKYFLFFQDNSVRKDRTLLWCENDGRTCYLTLSTKLSTIPREEDLKSIKVNVGANTCTLNRPQGFSGALNPKLIMFETTNRLENVSFKTDDTIDFTGMTHIDIFDEEMVRANEFTYTGKAPTFPEKGFFVQDFTNVVYNTVWKGPRSTFSLPVLLYSRVHETLVIKSVNTPGTYTFWMNQEGIYLANDEFLVGEYSFVKSTMSIESSSIMNIELIIFIQGFSPLIVPVNTENNFQLIKSLQKNEGFEFLVEFPGNKHQIMAYALSEKLKQQKLAVHYVENKPLSAQIIIYDIESYNLMAITQGYLTSNLEVLTTKGQISKGKLDKEAFCKIDINKLDKSNHNVIANYPKTSFFWMEGTNYNDVSLILVDKAFTSEFNPDKKYIDACGFNTIYEKRTSLMGFAESKDKFNAAIVGERRRII